MQEQDKHKNYWYSLCSRYGASEAWINKSFNQITEAYSSGKRHYHNLNHINDLLKSAEEYKSIITDYDSVNFAIWFHDLVYNAIASDNEEKSASLANKWMQELKISEEQINKVVYMIMVTKNHMSFADPNDNDTSLFLDFDLKILGQERNIYREYMNKIRQEYSLVPDLLYNPGRKKVLKKFLEAESLYKTEEFKKLYEDKARANIQFELEQL
ncbi:MAG: hypothetical protein ACK40G_14760 [Cytophagaceae bacterium]